MIQITHKSNSLRKAVAQAVVRVSKESTMEAVIQRTVPKGDVLEFARVAGLFAVKKTSDVIPDCHPLPVEFTQVSYELSGLEILISVEVHTVYKTGVEVEAMHGASVVALTLYDMLKPIDKSIEISGIRLLSKTGGKSDAMKLSLEKIVRERKAMVLVCSDSVSRGETQDKAGAEVYARLESLGMQVLSLVVLPDQIIDIQDAINKFASQVDLMLFVGGTGLSNRDVTPEAVRPLLTREIDGIMETARRYGQDRMPFAMLSRGVAGMVNDTLVITLPGSTKGAAETMDALFPSVMHVFAVKDGQKH
ncbi:MAG: bifunctional molybdenum cofactor biosynthesis protein MoaC/MoaB [Bacteroidetes bacterium]|nr:bifunctional molybdenum cofactor biosynthesis protein MoaC/MoaB [Bacteroidota bacterium]